MKPVPNQVRPDVSERFKITKERLKRDGVVFDANYVGMESREYTDYASQHKHGSHKRTLADIATAPVVEHTTEKVSEHNDGVVINGISMSAEQAIAYRNGQF